MRFMIIVKATAASEAGVSPDRNVIAAMAKFHEELSRAGVLLDANGLQPSANGWRIRCAGGHRTVIDGPFDDPRALVAGYTLIEVRSRSEALE
ncbi:MAG: YciI family protein, partial [Caldimonas sp.]